MISKIPSHFVLLWMRTKKQYLDIRQINSSRRGASWQWIPAACICWRAITPLKLPSENVSTYKEMRG